MNIAVIGSRNPSQSQWDKIDKFLRSLKGHTIVSGCADGIDTLALKTSRSLRLKTIGCVPWASYNQEIQRFCDKIVVLSGKHTDAYASVAKYHPFYYSQLQQTISRCRIVETETGGLKPAEVKLHARNYLIVSICQTVIAAPSAKQGLGGTGQGIRIALGLGINTQVVTPNGSIVDATKFSFDELEELVKEN